jgi:hypothetical protein
MSHREQLRREALLLARAAELVGAGWCPNGLARDADGRLVEPWSASACAWSPLGALLKAWFDAGDNGGDAFRVACAALAQATGGRLEEWNAARWRTKRHVASAFVHARSSLPSVRRRLRAVEAATERSSAGPAARRAAVA